MPLNDPKELKTNLHPRNKNRVKYDLKALMMAFPGLENYTISTKTGEATIDFSMPEAVKLLNKAILYHYYGIKHWDFPKENLCPPIPGRADYIHHIADLLAENGSSQGKQITCLDIGTGATCIYPIIGVTEYNWHFIASDIDPKSIASSENIINANAVLKGNIECRLQKNNAQIFEGIISENDQIAITICNPPFHASIADAHNGTYRKVKNLRGKNQKTLPLNFAGNLNELIYDGGEFKFIETMIKESETFAKNCHWFTTLVSKQSNLKGIYKLLSKTSAKQVKTIEMSTGNKTSRIVAWTYY